MAAADLMFASAADLRLMPNNGGGTAGRGGGARQPGGGGGGARITGGIPERNIVC